MPRQAGKRRERQDPACTVPSCTLAQDRSPLHSAKSKRNPPGSLGSRLPHGTPCTWGRSQGGRDAPSLRRGCTLLPKRPPGWLGPLLLLLPPPPRQTQPSGLRGAEGLLLLLALPLPASLLGAAGGAAPCRGSRPGQGSVDLWVRVPHGQPAPDTGQESPGLTLQVKARSSWHSRSQPHSIMLPSLKA